jgi:nucleotide-binding universal stress UspA family protein
MKKGRWIVVGIDFSPGAERALVRAAELAHEIGTSLACVHAYEDPPSAPLVSDQSEAARSLLDDAARLVKALFPDLKIRCFARRGAPWEKLANVAYEVGAELIVVGAYGEHGRLHPSFLGSVTTRVAALSERSVLVVPAPELGTLSR